MTERDIYAPLKQLIKESPNQSPTNLPGLLKEIEDRQSTITQMSASTPTLVEGWAAYKARRDQYLGKPLIGLATGMPKLDAHTLGLRGLILLGAGPNVGKTALGIQIGLNVIQNAQNNAVFLYVSLDMSKDDVLDRVVCCEAGVDWKTLKRGSNSLLGQPIGPWHTPEDRKRIDEADDRLLHGRLPRMEVLVRRDLGESYTAADLLARLKVLKKRAAATRAFIVIDYFQLIPVPDAGRLNELDVDRSRVKFVQDLLAGTRTTENPAGDAVVVISETRKPPTGKRSQWGGQLADFMGSARLPYAADAALLYQPMDDEGDEGIPNYEWPVPLTFPNREQLEERGILTGPTPARQGRDGMRRGKWALAFYFEKSQFVEVAQTTLCPRSSAPTTALSTRTLMMTTFPTRRIRWCSDPNSRSAPWVGCRPVQPLRRLRMQCLFTVMCLTT